MTQPNLISTEALDAHLGDPRTAVIDASWYMPAEQRDAYKEYLSAHIPGAVFFDIDRIADTSVPLPHMLPKPDALARSMGELGLSEDLRYVVYDGDGLFAAARVWWTLRVFGVQDVRVLGGGMPKWKAEGRRLEAGAVTRSARTFVAHFNAAAVADSDVVSRSLENGSAQVVDARSAPRFRGEVPEPRPGVRSGHIPRSFNLPYANLVADGQLKSPEAIRAEFRQAGIELNKPIITSCGSGVSAAILAMAVETAGSLMPQLYDGSWADWGSRPELPLATGPEETS